MFDDTVSGSLWLVIQLVSCLHDTHDEVGTTNITGWPGVNIM